MEDLEISKIEESENLDESLKH